MKALVAAGAGAAAAFAIAHANPEEEKAAVKSVMEAAAAAYEACDTASFGKYDVEGRTGYYPDSADPMKETPESRQEEIAFCEAGGKHAIDYTIKGVILLGDVAVAHGSGHYTRTEPDGEVSIDTDYTFTDILVKTKDGWKFRHGHIGVVLAEEPAGETQE
ncbi:MAG: hypothetical protein Kow00133_04090 [Amphiplicatus sp.]